MINELEHIYTWHLKSVLFPPATSDFALCEAQLTVIMFHLEDEAGLYEHLLTFQIYGIEGPVIQQLKDSFRGLYRSGNKAMTRTLFPYTVTVWRLTT